MVTKRIAQDTDFRKMADLGIILIGTINPRKSSSEIKCLISIKSKLKELKRSQDRKKYGFLINTIAGKHTLDADAICH